MSCSSLCWIRQTASGDALSDTGSPDVAEGQSSIGPAPMTMSASSARVMVWLRAVTVTTSSDEVADP